MHDLPNSRSASLYFIGNSRSGIFLLQISGSGKLGILWSHNNEGNMRWLGECIKAIEIQGFVWWDEGWRTKRGQLGFPITGFIYTTVEKQVTHAASIEAGRKTVSQPDRVLAEKVEANWYKLGLPFSDNDPLHKYLRGKNKTLTLLKLSKINKLEPPKGLEDFTLGMDGLYCSHHKAFVTSLFFKHETRYAQACMSSMHASRE